MNLGKVSLLPAALLVFAAPFVQAQTSAEVRTTPAQIKWNDIPVLPKRAKAATILGDATKAGPFAVRIRLPADTRVMPHTHPIDHQVTVISGVLYYGEGDKFDSKKLKAFPAGSFILEAAKVPHFMAARRETILQVNGTGPSGFDYIDPMDFPGKR